MNNVEKRGTFKHIVNADNIADLSEGDVTATTDIEADTGTSADMIDAFYKKLNELEDNNIQSSTDITANRNDNYFGEEAALQYGDMIAETYLNQTISKRKTKAEEPDGLMYEAHQLGIDPFDLLEALEGMCADGRAVEHDTAEDSWYEIVTTKRHPVETLFYGENDDPDSKWKNRIMNATDVDGQTPIEGNVTDLENIELVEDFVDRIATILSDCDYTVTEELYGEGEDATLELTVEYAGSNPETAPTITLQFFDDVLDGIWGVIPSLKFPELSFNPDDNESFGDTISYILDGWAETIGPAMTELNKFGYEHAAYAEEIMSASAIHAASDEYNTEHDRSVNINKNDSNIVYEDTQGQFTDAGGDVSLAELKTYWNDSNMSDPILAQYSSFEEWLSDTQRYLHTI